MAGWFALRIAGGSLLKPASHGIQSVRLACLSWRNWAVSRRWVVTWEAFGLIVASLVEHDQTGVLHGLSEFVGYHIGIRERQTGVVIFAISPLTEPVGPCFGILEWSEAPRIGWPVLHGLELCFWIRVVVGGVRACERSFFAQIVEQLHDRRRCHGTSPIAVDHQLIGPYALAVAGGLDQGVCQTEGLAVGEGPSHDESAEDVYDSVERIVGPSARSLERGDFPRPEHVAARRPQLRAAHPCGFRIGPSESCGRWARLTSGPIAAAAFTRSYGKALAALS